MAKKDALTTLENSYKQLIEMGFSEDELNEIISGDKKTLKPISQDEAIDAIVLYFKVKKVLSDKVIKGYLEKIKETDASLLSSRNLESLKAFENYANTLENSIVIANVASGKKEHVRSWENYFTDKIAEQEKMLGKSMNNPDGKVAAFKRLLENPFNSQFGQYLKANMDQNISRDIAYAINNEPTALETIRGLNLLLGRKSQISYTDVVLEGVYSGTKVDKLLKSNEDYQREVKALKKELNARDDINANIASTKSVLAAQIASILSEMGINNEKVVRLLNTMTSEIADNSSEIESIRQELVGIIDTSLDNIGDKVDSIDKKTDVLAGIDRKLDNLISTVSAPAPAPAPAKKSKKGAVAAAIGVVVPTIATIVLGILLARANNKIDDLEITKAELADLKHYIMTEQTELADFSTMLNDLKLGGLTEEELIILENKILASEVTDKVNNPSSTAYMRLMLDYAKLQQNKDPQTTDYLGVVQDFAKVISELEVALSDNSLSTAEKASIQTTIDSIKAQSDEAVKTLANEYGVDIENILKSFETPSVSENEYAAVKEFYDLYVQVLAGNATAADMQAKLDENVNVFGQNSQAVNMMSGMMDSADNIFDKVIFETETAELEEFMALYNKVITNSDGMTLAALDAAIASYDANSVSGEYSSTPIMNAFKAAAEEYLSADETPVVDSEVSKFYENGYKKYLAGEISLTELETERANYDQNDVIINSMMKTAKDYEQQKAENAIYETETKEHDNFVELYEKFLKGEITLQELNDAQEAAKQTDIQGSYSSTSSIEKVYDAAEVYENLINKVEQITGETTDVYEALDEIVAEINKLVESGAEIDNATVMDVLAYYAKEVARVNGLYDDVLANYNKVNGEYNAKVDEYNALYEQYQKALDNSVDEQTIADLKNQLAEKETELAALQTELQEALNEISQKNSMIADLQKQVEGKEDEISKLEEQLAAALDNSADEAVIADLKNQLAKKEAELANLEKLYEEALDNSEDEAKIAELQEKLNAKNKEVENLNKQLAANESTIENLEKQLSDKLEEINVLKASLDSSDKQIDELGEKVAELEAKLQELSQTSEGMVVLKSLYEKLYGSSPDGLTDEQIINAISNDFDLELNENSSGLGME